MVAKIRVFGVLRKFGSEGLLTVAVKTPCSVSEIRRLLKEQLAAEFPGSFHEELIERAALADGTRLLAEQDQVTSADRLTLLPPVCGG